MTTWTEWKTVNADKLAHPMGYETKFADLILSRIPLIEPGDVIPQFEFVDDKGRHRRVDFMILNADKGYRLPVELDGYNKSDENQKSSHWNDFLERQNALVRSFGIVLRYSNAQMFNNGASVIEEIAKTLSVQSSKSYADSYISTTIENIAIDAVAAVNTIKTISRGRPGGVAPVPAKRTLPAATPRRVASATPARSAPRKRPDRVRIAVLAALLAVLVGVAGAHALRDNPWPTALGGRTFAGPADPHAAEPTVDTASIAAHAGRRVKACGPISGVKVTRKATFINFDRPYPDATLTGVVWADNRDALAGVRLVQGASLCLTGLVGSYDGKPQIEINRAGQISAR